MADIVWDGAVAGQLYDDSQAFPVAESNGSGTILMYRDGISSPVFSGANRLIVQNAGFLAGFGFVPSLTFSADSLGVILDGESSPFGGKMQVSIPNGILLSPAASNHNCVMRASGCHFTGFGGGGSVAGIEAITAPSSVRVSGFFSNCKFSGSISAALGHINWDVGGDPSVGGTRSILDIRQCEFIGCSTEGDGGRTCIRVRGNTTDPTRYPEATIDHCSFLWRVLESTGRADLLTVVQRGTMFVKNSVVAIENTDGVQSSRLAEATGTGATFTSLGYNFVHSYETLDYGSWVKQATDQEADPLFISAVCATPVLSPSAIAKEVAGRNVDLWKSDEIGWYPGVVEPFNLGTYTAVSASGVQAVWGERKQRVYERPLMSKTNVGLRGRGIRVRVRATDDRSLKLIHGLWVKHITERVI